MRRVRPSSRRRAAAGLSCVSPSPAGSPRPRPCRGPWPATWADCAGLVHDRQHVSMLAQVCEWFADLRLVLPYRLGDDALSVLVERARVVGLLADVQSQSYVDIVVSHDESSLSPDSSGSPHRLARCRSRHPIPPGCHGIGAFTYAAKHVMQLMIRRGRSQTQPAMMRLVLGRAHAHPDRHHQP